MAVTDLPTFLSDFTFVNFQKKNVNLLEFLKANSALCSRYYSYKSKLGFLRNDLGTKYFVILFLERLEYFELESLL